MSCFQHHPLSYYGENKGKIGSGVYSHVQHYQREASETGVAGVAGEGVAIKVHTKNISAFREIALLEDCHSSPYIVPILDVGYDSRRQRFYQVMPLGDYTLYDQLLFQYFKKNPNRIKKAIFQIIHAIASLHVRGYIHRDVKSENILVFENKREKGKECNYRLCDFGLSRKSDLPGESYTSYMVTLYYRPPENLLDQDQYTCAIDMWSVGCIFAELILTNLPFAYDKSNLVLNKQLECLGNPTSSYPPYLQSKIKKINKKKFVDGKKWWRKNVEEKVCNVCGVEAYDLLSRLLQLDPSKRISARQALTHPYFSDFNRFKIKIPLIHLIRIYQPSDWRNQIPGMEWSDRNKIFLKCFDLGIENEISVHNIILCYFFLNKLFALTPRSINARTADLYMRAILSITSKINCCNFLHLRHVEENNDIHQLRKCRNKFLHIMKFQLTLHTGQDWFRESINTQRSRKLIRHTAKHDKILSEALALYQVTLFIPKVFFRFSHEDVAEGCLCFILKHHGFEITETETETKTEIKHIMEKISQNKSSAFKLLKKNKNFKEKILERLPSDLT